MFWRIFCFAFLVVGALAEYQVSDEQRQQFKSIITEYCKKNGAEDKANEVEQGVKDFVDCIKGLIDIETVKKEVEEAKPKGALDEVFKKYCEKSPQLKTCLHTLMDKIAPCTEETVREHAAGIKNATDQLITFVCYKDGDRIALFFAEGGPECFQAKANEIRTCAQKLKDNVPDVESAKKLTIQEQCGKFEELSTCVVKALETCETPTPGNMAESLFKFVRNGTPCATKN